MAAAAAIHLSGPPGYSIGSGGAATPPESVADGPDSTAFSTASAWRHIQAVAQAPHPVGTAEHDRVRAHVVSYLAGLGLRVDTQTTEVNLRRGSVLRSAVVRNVVARLPGRASTGAVLLMAHYDAVPLSFGAGDDGLGLSTVLETARALVSGPRPRNDIIFLLTDAEEVGLMGARAFAAEHPWMEDVGVVLNFEARGTSGAALMFETGPGSGWAVRALASEGARPVASSLFPEVYRYLPNDTDFSVFRRRGLPGLNFAIGGSARWYHTPGDHPAHVSRASLRHMGLNALAMARTISAVDLSEPRATEPVYFHVPVLGLVVYPRSLAVPLAVVLGLGYLVVAVYARRRGRLSLWSTPVALLTTLALLAAAVGVGLAVVAVVRSAHPEYGSLSGSAIYREWPYALALVALAVAAVYGTFGLLRRWFGAPELALGALLLPVGLSVAAAFLAPGASYLLLWPSLLALAMVLLLVATPDPARPPLSALGALLLLSVGVLWLLAPVVHLVSVFLSIAAAAVIAVVASVVALLLLPTLDVLGRPHRAWLPATGLVLALGLVGFGVATSEATAERPAPASVLHVQDLDRQRASWAVPLTHDNAYTRRFVPPSADSMRLGLYSSYVGGWHRVASAPAWALTPLRPEVSSGSRGDERIMRVRLPLGDSVLAVEVYPDQGTSTRLVSPAATPAADSGSVMPGDGRWGLIRWGPGPSLDLELVNRGTTPARLVVIRHYPGLPSFRGGPDTTRPPGVMATPRAAGRSTLSDRRLVRETVLVD